MAPQLSSDEIAKLSHSPVHHAVARRDYVALRRLTLSVPKLGKAGDIKTESDAIAEERRAEALSAVLDRRDVPGRETALHLAVRIGDATAAEILMAAGIDWSLQNEQGWNALQEAICAKEEAIAMVIMRYHQPMAWAKWCRRLPRLVAAMQRMRDFYMELTFHFESSVIPFIGKVAPSDTYRIWKHGCNLRADMTLAGFDGFKIQRCDQSFLFLGEGSEDGLIPPGSLCLLNHKDREIMNASALASSELSEVEIAQEVALMSQTNLYRPGLDVTQAELFPQLSWRRQEKTEMVGPWKAKVYDMHHVTISLKSRKVPGSMTDNELFGIGKVEREDGYLEDLTDSLTEEEKQQLEAALSIDSVETDQYTRRSRKSTNMADLKRVDCSKDESPYAFEFEENPSERDGKKGWLGWGKQSSKQSCVRKVVPGRSSLCIDEKVSNLLGDETSCEEHFQKGSKCHRGHKWVESRRFSDFRPEESYHDAKKLIYEEHSRKRRVTLGHEGRGESEYKKGLRPVLWLTPSFPLKTEELLPLLDILADKVKAVRRLRELLTTKLPAGMFPVKMAIPVVPTVRVIVTFTKFEELQPENEEFSTPSSSPGHGSDANRGEARQSSTSWLSWMKGATGRVAGLSDAAEDRVRCTEDPFVIPTGYAWTSIDAKKKGSKDKKSRRKGLKYGQAGVDPPDISNGQDRP